MSSKSRQFFMPDDLAMLDRVLADANFHRSSNPLEREARLSATRYLIASFQQGLTSEVALRSSLADRASRDAPIVESIGYDLARRTFSERNNPAKALGHSGGGCRYSKRVENDGSWTVCHVLTGIPAQVGSWKMVDLNAKTALRALKILNTTKSDA